MDIEKTVRNLKENGFGAVLFDTAQDACAYLCGRVRNTGVGVGGSVTVQQMGLYEKLCENNEVFWHWIKPGPETVEAASRAPVYITSANGVSETGALINIDGRGNRVSSSLFGHDTVYFVCGTNKIRPTVDEAVRRARNTAAPLNARRLRLKTPCASGELVCHDCSSPDRICNALVVLLRKPYGVRNAEVVLIKESLGY